MRCFVALLALGSVASAQAILEHAVAASVGSVAGVAGKKVNEGLDKVLATVNKAASVTPEPPAQQSQATGQRITAPEPGANAAMSPYGPAAPAHRPAQPSRPNRDQRAKNLLTTWELRSPAEPAAQPPGATSDELKQIEVGTARQELLARLGPPVSRFSIPDENGLVEVYHYHSHGEPSGSVRLLNGSVTAVRPN